MSAASALLLSPIPRARTPRDAAGFTKMATCLENRLDMRARCVGLIRASAGRGTSLALQPRRQPPSSPAAFRRQIANLRESRTGKTDQPQGWSDARPYIEGSSSFGPLAVQTTRSGIGSCALILPSESSSCAEAHLAHCWLVTSSTRLLISPDAAMPDSLEVIVSTLSVRQS